MLYVTSCEEISNTTTFPEKFVSSRRIVRCVCRRSWPCCEDIMGDPFSNGWGGLSVFEL